LSLPAEELARRAQELEWLLLDVDGVLTPGGLLYSAAGEEILRFEIKDGLAIQLARQAGLKVAILSGRANPAVRRRATELRVDSLVLGRSDKGPAYEELLTSWGVDRERVAAIGDDLQDLPVLQSCGLSFAPADGVVEVLESVDQVLATPGGYGAVREMVECILEARGQWEGLVAQFRGPRA
jgi:3-deoxy-D-manno-octulosonate 8-phosphate phosphatase (KDO 8-P phosphatase)